MMYLMLIIGFVCLIKGADLFVDGSCSVAKLLKVPGVIIGLTIVAMGTSAPETAVSISAGLKGINELAISNVVGSNFFNLLVVVGVCAIMQPVAITNDLMKRDYPYSIVVTLLLIVFLGLNVVIGGGAPTLGRYEAIIFLVIFAAYLVILLRSALKARREGVEEEEEINVYSPLKSILLIVIGLIGVVIGGDLVVDNAKLIAKAFGMSDTLIGLTIVAIGTSLPELVTSIVASRKGQNDMALGNVVGSNIFNILLVLGISASIKPITVTSEALIDAIILLFVNLVVLALIVRDKTLCNKNGIIMILLYVVYTAYIICRNYGIIFG